MDAPRDESDGTTIVIDFGDALRETKQGDYYPPMYPDWVYTFGSIRP